MHDAAMKEKKDIERILIDFKRLEPRYIILGSFLREFQLNLIILVKFL